MKNFKRLLFLFALGGLVCGGGINLPTSSGKSAQSAFDENGLLKGPYDLYASKADFEAAKKADDRILVQTHEELKSETLRKLGIVSLESLGGKDGWSIAYLAHDNASEEVDIARKSGLFTSVDYDYEYQSDAVDYEPIAGNPSKDDEYWLNQCGVVDAWKYMAANGGTAGGTSNTVVAVIDTGVDYNHEDLKANMWVNTKEIPNNGIDDDNNGYVDDYYGANCVANTGDPMDDHGHGTHVAGLIAGANNSLGVVGVAYNCKIMAIKAGNSSGYFLNSDIAKALNYAYSMGADVINMSFGGTATTQAVESALETAYGRAALVAAAGNDGMPNEYKYGLPTPVAPIYPASYTFVLGVMSETQSGYESSFTNIDTYPDNSIEYDIYAPGEQMVSCLPNNHYAKWSGTSMAAPVVSGVAALLRSQYKDRDVYPTKYLMSQIIEASSNAVTCIHKVEHNVPHGLNADDAFTKIPKPTVSLYQYYTFDDASIATANNGNGIIDAGETINLGIELQNKGGQAKDVTATIDVTRAGGVSDTYVSIVTPTVNYGPIGTYSILGNGLTRDTKNNVTGVSNPLAVKIADNCPNDYLCDINVSFSWKNGLDTTDETSYSGTSKIRISIHHGIILPTLISSDTTLLEGSLYILAKTTVVEEGVTLTIQPGVSLQWYADTSSYYVEDVTNPSYAKLLVNGTINAIGTAEKPINFFVSQLFIVTHYVSYAQLKGSGTFAYCTFQSLCNSSISDFDSGATILQEPTAMSFSHCSFLGDTRTIFQYRTLTATTIEDSMIFQDSSCQGGRINQLKNCVLFIRESKEVEMSWVSWPYDKIHITGTFSNNVIYGTSTNGDFSPAISLDGCDSDNNSYLSANCIRSLKKWTSFVAGTNTKTYLKNQYWSDTPSEVIDSLIHDFKDDGTSGLVDYTTYTGSGDLTAVWPFVKNVHMEDDAGNTLTTVSTNKVKVVVDFNRDMDTTMDLDVAFGSVEPYNDYTISGSFASKTQWVGTYTFKTLIENGQQYWRISNGRADADHFKTLMTDKQRFGFLIDTTAAQSMALNAVSDASGVTLTWAQDDYTTLAGYNVYRSDTKEGTYKKLNAVLIPYDVATYKDTTALPGKTYFYYFTVVMTDFTESHPSGATSVTTLDTEAPSLYHTAVTEAYLGSNLVVTATITDNVGITGATLSYRVKGSSTWLSTTMTHLNSAYSGIIDASYLTSAGLEYYISATDGINVVTSGSADAPHSVTCKSAVTQNQKGDVDGDGMITVKDALMVLKSINGDLTLTTDQKTRGDVDNDGTLTAADALAILQYANGTITKF